MRIAFHVKDPARSSFGWLLLSIECAWCGEKMLWRTIDGKAGCPHDCASGLGITNPLLRTLVAAVEIDELEPATW